MYDDRSFPERVAHDQRQRPKTAKKQKSGSVQLNYTPRRNECFRLLWTYESETNHLATDLLSDGERRLLVVSS